MTRSPEALRGAVGLGYRSELAPELHAHRDALGFLEVVAESCYGSRSTLRELVALSRSWPVVPHGVKLSLGSAEGIEPARAEKLGWLARQLGAPACSEHVAFSSAGGLKIGHLTPLPRSLEAVRVVARNVERARRALGVPLWLENVACGFALPGDQLSEAAFYQEIVAHTGCDLLFDVANLYANARNAGVDPVEALREFPVERAAMLHVAGGVFEHGFYFDTHAHPVPDAVFDLLAQVFARAPEVPVLLERDAGFSGGIQPLLAELERVRSHRGGSPSMQGIPPKNKPSQPSLTARRRLEEQRNGDEERALLEQQESLARLLTRSDTARDRWLAEQLGRDALDRARGVLDRKRVDEALAVLPRLRRAMKDVTGLTQALAESIIRAAPRTRRMQAISDALAIAGSPHLSTQERDAGLRDALVLRARFALDASGAQARSLPFVTRGLLSNGAPVWAIKGFGAEARVVLRERRPAS